MEIDPTNQYAPDANTLLQKIADAVARVNRKIADWAGANGSHSAAPLELYLQEFPNGEHAAEARSQLAQVAEEQAHQAELVYQEYARQAQLSEDAAWATAKQGGRGAIMAYLNQYPNGRYTETAKELIVPRPETDPLTKLMWTPEPNGNDVDWSAADNYCSSLRLGGYTDWRLPTIEEFLAVDNKVGDHFIEQIQAPYCLYWTSSKEGTEKASLYFGFGVKMWERTKYSGIGEEVGCGFRALCVRGPAQ